MAEQVFTLERLYVLVLKLHKSVKEFKKELRAEQNKRLDKLAIQFDKKCNESFKSLNKMIEEHTASQRARNRSKKSRYHPHHKERRKTNSTDAKKQ